MPNWVVNYLTIEGSHELTKQLKEQVGQPYTMPVQSNGDLAFSVEDRLVESPFSFWNIIRPMDMEAYVKQPDFTSDKPYSGDDWYSWNNRNWGCKWDASDPSLINEQDNGDNNVLLYQFDTPWGPPLEVLTRLSNQYPSLLITLEWEEEQGFGGEIEFLKGAITAESSYDSKCWECDATDTIDYCEECEINVCSECNQNREGDKCEHDL